jgi:hypothetical protein
MIIDSVHYAPPELWRRVGEAFYKHSAPPELT